MEKELCREQHLSRQFCTIITTEGLQMFLEKLRPAAEMGVSKILLPAFSELQRSIMAGLKRDRRHGKRGPVFTLQAFLRSAKRDLIPEVVRISLKHLLEDGPAGNSFQQSDRAMMEARKGAAVQEICGLVARAATEYLRQYGDVPMARLTALSKDTSRDMVRVVIRKFEEASKTFSLLNFDGAPFDARAVVKEALSEMVFKKEMASPKLVKVPDHLEGLNWAVNEILQQTIIRLSPGVELNRSELDKILCSFPWIEAVEGIGQGLLHHSQVSGLVQSILSELYRVTGSGQGLQTAIAHGGLERYLKCLVMLQLTQACVGFTSCPGPSLATVSIDETSANSTSVDAVGEASTTIKEIKPQVAPINDPASTTIREIKPQVAPINDQASIDTMMEDSTTVGEIEAEMASLNVQTSMDTMVEDSTTIEDCEAEMASLNVQASMDTKVEDSSTIGEIEAEMASLNVQTSMDTKVEDSTTKIYEQELLLTAQKYTEKILRLSIHQITQEDRLAVQQNALEELAQVSLETQANITTMESLKMETEACLATVSREETRANSMSVDTVGEASTTIREIKPQVAPINDPASTTVREIEAEMAPLNDLASMNTKVEDSTTIGEIEAGMASLNVQASMDTKVEDSTTKIYEQELLLTAQKYTEKILRLSFLQIVQEDTMAVQQNALEELVHVSLETQADLNTMDLPVEKLEPRLATASIEDSSVNAMSVDAVVEASSTISDTGRHMSCLGDQASNNTKVELEQLLQKTAQVEVSRSIQLAIDQMTMESEQLDPKMEIQLTEEQPHITLECVLPAMTPQLPKPAGFITMVCSIGEGAESCSEVAECSGVVAELSRVVLPPGIVTLASSTEAAECCVEAVERCGDYRDALPMKKKNKKKGGVRGFFRRLGRILTCSTGLPKEE